LIQTAEAQDIDPTVLAGLIYVESRWTPDAVSRSGACGLTQVLPRYVDETCDELKDPATSIIVGTRSLKKWTTMRVRRNGRLVRVPRTGGMRTALACYNAGYACADSPGGRSYADAVLRYSRRIQNLLDQQTESPTESQKATPNLSNMYMPVHEAGAGGYYRPLYIVGSL